MKLKIPKNNEQKIENIKFNLFKFNNRPYPLNSRDVIIICAFSEFGCETLGINYCVPDILKNNAGKYSIVVGWYGREYLYRHLVDEFWEIKEEHQWLRDYSNAFKNTNKNIKNLEISLKNYGKLITTKQMGNMVVGNFCLDCGSYWGNKEIKCPSCKSENIRQSLFSDIYKSKKNIRPIPKPSTLVLNMAKEYLPDKEKVVGIFARGRSTYGRNLQPEFYIKLIELLEKMGYGCIWLGEKQSVQPCPVEHVLDFSRLPEARNLELTLAIISQLKFTIQFWTASTRLASMMGIPYLLFESPDQIWGVGQEGIRRSLCDLGPSKLVASHFLNVYNDHIAGLELVKESVKEMEIGNWEDKMGLLDTEQVVPLLKRKNDIRIGVKT